MRHLLDIDDLSAAELRRVLELARLASPPAVLAGRGMALIFEKPSTRTRNATEMAVVALGGHPVVIRGDEIGFGTREPVEDVTRALSEYHALLGARVFDHGTLEAMAAVDRIPVVNLLSDRAHPGQAVADLLTLTEHWGVLEGHTLAWVGDGNNVARSLLHACARSQISVRLAVPAGHCLDDATIDGARAEGIEVTVTSDPYEAVDGADVVSTDTWVSMGQEGEAPARLDAFARYRVDEALMAAAAPGAAFLHCLPAHRGEEVAAAVIDGPASLVWRQAANRMHAARGIMLWLVEQGWLKEPAR
ncbi:MAG: ornithine carbamoyltransferase [Acidimicrobiales bacterium]